MKIVVGICACVSLYRGIKSSSASDSQKMEETDGAFGSVESVGSDMCEADASETVVSEADVSEAEVYTLLEDRGFDVETLDIIAEYDIDCNSSLGHRAFLDSTDRHPEYYTLYLSVSDDISADFQRYIEGPMDDEEDESFWDEQEDNDTIWPKKEWKGYLLLWDISIIDGGIIATPASYILENNLPGGDIEVVEKEVLTGFGSSLKKFYKYIPNEGTMHVKVVDRVDRKTLDSISNEVLDQLCAEN